MVAMEAMEFITRIQPQYTIKKEDINDFKKIVEDYPYFQTAMVHLLKMVHTYQPEQYETLLQKTASRTFDRSLLYRWIEEPQKQNNRSVEEQIPDPEDLTLKTEVIADPAPITITDAKFEKKEQEKAMNFLEWVRSMDSKPRAPKREAPLHFDDKIEMIENFIAKSPKISAAPKEGKMVDLSSESWASSNELMTETLAKIFVKQKKFKKAIKAYEILSLKYPEKNGFFADQIQIINNKLKE